MNGDLRFPDGCQLLWRRANFFVSRWAFLQNESEALVHFRYHHRMFRSEGRLDLTPCPATFPDAPLVLVLGWYLMFLASS